MEFIENASREQLGPIKDALAKREDELRRQEEQVAKQTRAEKRDALVTNLVSTLFRILEENEPAVVEDWKVQASDNVPLSEWLDPALLKASLIEAIAETPVGDMWVEKRVEMQFGDETPCSNDGNCYYCENRSRMPQCMTLSVPVFPSATRLCDVCVDYANTDEIIAEVAVKDGLFSRLDECVKSVLSATAADRGEKRQKQ